jgi:hypothetical protein
MDNVKELMNCLELIVGRKQIGKFGPSVTLNPSYNEFPHKELVEDHFYVHTPKEELGKRVKWIMRNYAREKGLHVVVATKYSCGYECQCPHQVDPFNPDSKGYGDNVFINTFPEDMSGAYVYFLNEDNYVKCFGAKPTNV